MVNLLVSERKFCRRFLLLTETADAQREGSVLAPLGDFDMSTGPVLFASALIAFKDVSRGAE